MAFPFLPYGLLFGCAVLVVALALFGLLTVLLDRTFAELRLSILPGLVAGVRAWTLEPGEVPPSSARAWTPAPRDPAGPAIEDLLAPPDIDVVVVRR